MWPGPTGGRPRELRNVFCDMGGFIANPRFVRTLSTTHIARRRPEDDGENVHLR
ncbi:hypothetical protein NOCARDAX2BIS_140080 [Nocardioides sp. AX2bis]|nr:hypothetical protein NOCARDAX2BIS_140080 [Nocardioides sp. AX2bis]